MRKREREGEKEGERERREKRERENGRNLNGKLNFHDIFKNFFCTWYFFGTFQ